MAFNPEFITAVEQELRNPLPGKKAQFEMAAIGRPSYNAVPRPDVRTASVMISLFEKGNDWHTVVIQRKAVEGDRHSGQISFPGGKRENQEPLPFTAIRESHEEIGTPIDSYRILGQLTELHIPVSNFMVHPFVGHLDHPGELIAQQEEVDAIYEIPIEILLTPETRKRKDIRVPEGFVLRDVPYFDIGGKVVWGATAMIISEFTSVLNGVAPLVSRD